MERDEEKERIENVTNVKERFRERERERNVQEDFSRVILMKPGEEGTFLFCKEKKSPLHFLLLSLPPLF